MYPDYIQKLMDCPKEHLTAAQIARVVGMDANSIRYLAREMPERLPFPAIVGPNNVSVRFPKRPFLKAFGYEE